MISVPCLFWPWGRLVSSEDITWTLRNKRNTFWDYARCLGEGQGSENGKLMPASLGTRGCAWEPTEAISFGPQDVEGEGMAEWKVSRWQPLALGQVCYSALMKLQLAFTVQQRKGERKSTPAASQVPASSQVALLRRQARGSNITVVEGGGNESNFPGLCSVLSQGLNYFYYVRECKNLECYLSPLPKFVD